MGKVMKWQVVGNRLLMALGVVSGPALIVPDMGIRMPIPSVHSCTQRLGHQFTFLPVQVREKVLTKIRVAIVLARRMAQEEEWKRTMSCRSLLPFAQWIYLLPSSCALSWTSSEPQVEPLFFFSGWRTYVCPWLGQHQRNTNVSHFLPSV